MLEDVKIIIECTLMMENEINDFNKEPTFINLERQVEKICKWAIEIDD